jgi:hypothetical protein
MIDEHVRMRIALRLLLEPHNEYKESLQSNARKHWNNLMAKRAYETRK